MYKKRNTKRALMASLLSMVMCTSMLIGSTFAWFTDNATTNVNTIQSGTLDIQLLAAADKDAENLEGKTLKFADLNGKTDILFEPGAMFKLQDVYLYNAGNLNAKYRVSITGIDGNAELAKVLDVYVNDVPAGTLESVAAQGIIKENQIAPGTFDTFGTIALKMQEEAKNEYQGLKMEGIAITVQATQAAVEYDSYNNTYDETATYDEPPAPVDPYADYAVVTVTNQTELNEAIVAATVPTKFVLNGSSFTPFTNIPKEVENAYAGKDFVFFGGTPNAVIDEQNLNVNYMQILRGTKLTFDGVTVNWAEANNNSYQGFAYAEKVTYRNCTITGCQFMYGDAEFDKCTFESYKDYAVYCRGNDDLSTAVFTDCTFNTGGKAVMMYSDHTNKFDAVLTNCVFNGDGTLATDKAAVETGDNPNDPANTSEFNITITGCTANNFAENPNGIATNSTLWANKNSMPNTRLNVIIDGVDVY